MEKCEKCGSKKIEEEVKNIPDNPDNVLKKFKCQECKFEKAELVHIG